MQGELPCVQGRACHHVDADPDEEIPAHKAAALLLPGVKEATCRDRFITTGVRWAESVKRRNNRGVYENFTADPAKKIILNNDNDDNRRLFESCALKANGSATPSWTGQTMMYGTISAVSACL